MQFKTNPKEIDRAKSWLGDIGHLERLKSLGLDNESMVLAANSIWDHKQEHSEISSWFKNRWRDRNRY